MLTYAFTELKNVALYEQLYNYIKEDILIGRLKPEYKLPSKRSFAKNLGISVITVENAYDQLMAEGYIYSLPKKGFYVATLPENNFSEGEALPQAPAKINKVDEYTWDFSSNKVIQEQFPFSIWAKILRECLRDYQEKLLDTSPQAGSYELRLAIAKHLRDFRGMQISPEQIIIGAGTEYLYGQLVQLLGHDKIYGVEDPGYKKMAQVYAASGAKVEHISFTKDGMNILELEKFQVDVAHTSPSHQFPTGYITPITKRYELLSWAQAKASRYIIEDDFDSEFRMAGKPIPTLQSIDSIEKVIYMNTFTKSIAPNLRISYMVLPPHLTKIYHEKLNFYSCPVTSMIQLALARFINEGYFEKHINRMRNFYRKERDELLALIKNSESAKYVNISEEDAGLHLLLNLNIPCTDEEFQARLKAKKLRLPSLSQYYHQPQTKSSHNFILNYSSLSEKNLAEAVTLLCEEIIKINAEC